MDEATLLLFAEYVALQSLMAVIEHEYNSAPNDHDRGVALQKLAVMKTEARVALRDRFTANPFLATMNPRTFQLLLEYIALQARASIVDHEHRVHLPQDIGAAQRVTAVDKNRKQLLNTLRADLVRA